MDLRIESRVKEVALYMLENKTTIRATAKKFGVSKSTILRDMTLNLKAVAPQYLKEVRQIIELNKNQRGLRGGEATRRKYKGA